MASSRPAPVGSCKPLKTLCWHLQQGAAAEQFRDPGLGATRQLWASVGKRSIAGLKQ